MSTALILILLAIGLPWLGALIVWWTGDKHPRLQNTFAVAFSVAAGVVAVILLTQTSPDVLGYKELPIWGRAFGYMTFVADGLGVFLAVIATVIGSLAVIFSIDYMKGEHQLGRYYAFVLFFIGAMVGLVLTNNILMMFFFWEITALCSYALIAFHNDDPKAVAGGIKALIITQIGGVGLLVGALVCANVFGTFEISQFLERASMEVNPIPLTWMAFGCLAAAAAKSAQFPFQTWLPDAMEAPTPISALIHAATMVNAGVYLLARFYPAFEEVPYWTTAVVAVGAITALMAAVMALVANDLKRVLAYSTVSQLGYMVYAIGAGGVLASQFHLFSHSVFKALLFLGAGAVIHAAGTRDMRQMGGIGKQMPLVRNVFIIGALALAGIPIFNGFWSKELVLENGLAHGPVWAYVIMLIGAGLTALYTFRCVTMVFFGERRSETHLHDAGPAMKTALIPLALGTLVTWLAFGPFSEMLKNTLPFHEIETEGTLEFVTKIVTDPFTMLALFVVTLGLAAWCFRSKLTGLSSALKFVGDAAQASFGFEWINRGIVSFTQWCGETLRGTQTGLLNWNVAYIVGALAIVLAILLMGA